MPPVPVMRVARPTDHLSAIASMYEQGLGLTRLVEFVDHQGFDMMDRKLLLAVIQKFDGGPVGIDSLAAAISEERGTIEDVIEPYLIQQGFMMRTARGRMATRTAWLHFGLNPPARELAGESDLPDLFGSPVDPAP